MRFASSVMSAKDDDDDGVVLNFVDIVQSAMAMMPLEYHAFSSAQRTATSAEAFLTNKRDQERNSSFVTTRTYRLWFTNQKEGGSSSS